MVGFLLRDVRRDLLVVHVSAPTGIGRMFDAVFDPQLHVRSLFAGETTGLMFGARSMLARVAGGNGKQDGSRMRDRLTARRSTFSQLAGAQ